MNRVRKDRGFEAMPYEQLHPHTSAGARGLIGASFGLKPGDPSFDELWDDFLDHYAAALAVNSTLFDGIPALLKDLRQRNLGWGVVTNKAARFTDPLVHLIGLGDADYVISGDTTAHPKPHPEPLLEAARRLNVAPHECWYVGGDLRNIQAGQALRCCGWRLSVGSPSHLSSNMWRNNRPKRR